MRSLRQQTNVVFRSFLLFGTLARKVIIIFLASFFLLCFFIFFASRYASFCFFLFFLRALFFFLLLLPSKSLLSYLFIHALTSSPLYQWIKKTQQQQQQQRRRLRPQLQLLLGPSPDRRVRRVRLPGLRIRLRRRRIAPRRALGRRRRWRLVQPTLLHVCRDRGGVGVQECRARGRWGRRRRRGRRLLKV